LDSFDVKTTREEIEMLRAHYLCILNNPRWSKGLPVFVPENNYAMPDHLAEMIKDLPIYVYNEKPDRIGVYKSVKASESYRFDMSMALYENKISFEHQMFTRTPEATPLSMRKMLQDQMERYRYANKKANDVFGKDRRKLTGKVGGYQDDLLITFMMAYSWGKRCWIDPAIRQKLGGR